MPSALRDVLVGATVIKIEPGGYFVSTSMEHVLVTVLGSCISACLCDPAAGIGGMNHFMLPSSVHGEWDGTSASMRYGNFAMEKLINDILRGGGRRDRLQAKLFGGASMIGESTIGVRNAAFAEAYLKAERIGLVTANVLGRHARCVHYAATSGRAFMRVLPLEDGSVMQSETSYAASLNKQPESGSIELFGDA